jgi:hypothetical protein
MQFRDTGKKRRAAASRNHVMEETMNMNQKFVVRRDTGAWQFQVWASFGLAIFLCALGVINLPGQYLDRAFLALGCFFCLSSSFVLAKTVRDNQNERVDTQAWLFQVWAAFFVAVVLTGWGLLRMDMGPWEKGYMIATWLYLVSAAFTLQKTIRDKHEADLIEGNVGELATGEAAHATTNTALAA